MSGIINQVDKGLAGFSAMSQLTNIQPHGPLPYTSYDMFKHFAGAISIIKFIAHVFSLPLMVMLRKNFGMRYVDPIHISLSFIIWQVAGMFAFGDTILSKLASPMIGGVAWLFLPIAFYHRYRAKQAALQGEGYSYHPGMPLLAPAVLVATGVFFRLLDATLGKLLGPVPRILTHPREVFEPELIQGAVRRFVDPIVVGSIGMLLMALEISIGFGGFLIWTSLLLFADETISARSQFELFLDAVDGQVIAKEKQRALSGATGFSATGHSLASIASMATHNQAAISGSTSS